MAEIGIRLFKIPSGEITNMPLLQHVGEMKVDIILSTGMCWLSDVEAAIRTLSEAGAKSVTVLHCVTEYPAPTDQINLRAMRTLAESFKLPVGYSDHTAGIDISIAAVALGATIIEKHFTLDTDMQGPDHSASLDPVEFSKMVVAVRHVELALGDGVKQPALCEIPNMPIARKSIVASCDLKKGQQIAVSDLTSKRPGSGIPPTERDNLIGKTLTQDVSADEQFRWNFFR